MRGVLAVEERGLRGGQHLGRALRHLRGERARLGEQLVVGHHAVHEPDLRGLGRRDHARREHQLERLRPADEARQQVRAAEAGQEAELREGERRASRPAAARRTSQGSIIVTPTPIAAPLIAAITGFGIGEQLERKLRRKSSSPSLGPLPAGGAGLVRLQRVEVDARAEAAARAGQDHRAHRVVVARARGRRRPPPRPSATV